MRFDALDRKMRVFETAHDHCVLPGIYIVARLDGRSFTRLTGELCQFDKPFDVRFRDHMIAVTQHVMTCGFHVVYGYTQSDEISLLLHRAEDLFGRKERKLNSIPRRRGQRGARPGARPRVQLRLPRLPASHRRGRGRLLPLAPGGRAP